VTVDRSSRDVWPMFLLPLVGSFTSFGFALWSRQVGPSGEPAWRVRRRRALAAPRSGARDASV